MRPSQFECEDFVGSDMMGKLQEERFRVIIHYSYQLQGLYNFSIIYLIATVTALCVFIISILSFLGV